jgi:hypothetical protein
MKACEHEADWSSVTVADCTPPEGIVDVACRKCGRLGSTRIEPAEVQWDDEPDTEGRQS